MPTVQDQLETVLRAVGLASYQADLGKASAAVKKLSEAEQEQARQQQFAKQRLDAVVSSLQNVAAQYLTFQALTQTVTRSLNEFAEAEAVAFTARFAFRGQSGLFERMNELAGATSRLTGVDDELILRTTQVFHQLGLQERQVRSLTEATLDLARGRGIAPQAAQDAILQALIGRANAVNRLGVEYKRTGDLARDAAALERAIQFEFGGAAAGFRGTFGGGRDQLGVDIGNVLAQLGQRIAPREAQDALSRHLQYLNDNFDQILSFVKAALPQFAGLPPFARTPEQRRAEEARLEALTGKGRGGNPKTRAEALLEDIEKNTRPQTDALTRQILGGGPLSQAAFNVRGLNAALRAVR